MYEDALLMVLTPVVMFGIGFGLRDATIFDTPRQWAAARSQLVDQLLQCRYCTGFHAGWLAFALLPSSWVWDPTTLLYGLIYAFMGVFFCPYLDLVLLGLEKKHES